MPQILCVDCNLGLADLVSGVDGKMRCFNCHDSVHRTCENCSDRFMNLPEDIGPHVDHYALLRACTACRRIAHICENCDNAYYDEGYTNGDARYCSESCYDDSFPICDNCDCRYDINNGCSCEEDIPDRPELPVEYIECYLPNRAFGVELETSQKLDQPDGWHRIYDGSVDGMEYLSGPCLGLNGIDKITKGCEELSRSGECVDDKCGFHLHLNARDLEQRVIENFVRFGEKFQPYFYAMVPISRFKKGYSRPIPPKFVTLPLEEALYGNADTYNKNYYKNQHSHDTRYLWMNVHSYFYRGTVEIRLHSGTTVAEKVLNWTEMWLKLLEYCKSNDWTQFDCLFKIMEAAGVRECTIDFYRKRMLKFNKGNPLGFRHVRDVYGDEWALEPRSVNANT